MSPEILMFIGVAVLIVGVGRWRWNVANQPALTGEQCEQLSDGVIEDMFDKVSDAGVFVPFHPNYWRQAGLTNSQWIYLCRWMLSRGLVYTPGDWGWLAIIFNAPPTGLALTPKTMGLVMDGRRQPGISIGDGNGPINIGGQQVVIAGQSLSGDDLRALIQALRDDARGLPERDASSVIEAANALQGVADGRVPETSPDVAAALVWVRERVSEAVGNAGGAALWAGTVAVAKALGWLS